MLGHVNQAPTRFCGECGLQMDVAAQAAGVTRADPRPRPAAELSPEELAERERQHAAAVAAAAQFERSQQSYVPTEGEAILIHFVADGLTAFGQIWFRGQELEIGPGHPRWPEAKRWITLSRFEQIERWGEQKFDYGPWPGKKSYTEAEGSFEVLQSGPRDAPVLISGPNQAQLSQADQAERMRNRAVPALAFY